VTLPNIITLVRLALTPLLPVFIYCYAPGREDLRIAALVFYVLASLSDWIDGLIARYGNQRSELGARLDPLADKLLVNLGYIFVAANPHFDPGVPMWFPVLLLLRDGGIIFGAIYIHRHHGELYMAARTLGKVTTLVNMITLVLVLMNWWFAEYMIYVCVAAAALSGADYALHGRRNLIPKEPAHG